MLEILITLAGLAGAFYLGMLFCDRALREEYNNIILELKDNLGKINTIHDAQLERLMDDIDHARGYSVFDEIKWVLTKGDDHA